MAREHEAPATARPLSPDDLASAATSDVRGAPQPVGAVLRASLAGSSGEAAAASGAMRLWLRVAGAQERAHTCGAYLREPRGRDSLPTLLVYVDSSGCVVDFRARGEVYLARLSALGAGLAGVEFRLSRNAARHRAARSQESAPPAPPDLPPAAPDDEDRARALVEGLPDGLRERAFRAICVSLRRERLEQSREEETSR